MSEDGERKSVGCWSRPFDRLSPGRRWEKRWLRKRGNNIEKNGFLDMDMLRECRSRAKGL